MKTSPSTHIKYKVAFKFHHLDKSNTIQSSWETFLGAYNTLEDALSQKKFIEESGSDIIIDKITNKVEKAEYAIMKITTHMEILS